MTSAPALADVVAALERRYPLAAAEAWDAVGLVAGDPARPVRRVLFAVDPVAAVADEAVNDAKKSQAQNQFDQGKVFHASKNWQKAIACYKEAVRLDPTVADYHAYLGVAYKQQGLKTPAQNAFAAAYKIDKKHKLLKEHYQAPDEPTAKGKGKGKGKGAAKPGLLDAIMAMFSGGGKKDAKGKPGAKKGTAPLKKAGAKK